ncbi:MAG: hypothetical protein M1823_001674 [Watsoniomyces obsoletus]|nr:MAG: hypothetical protein M1823_001674 [Watsoniomyces obsoletus]
MQRHESFPHHSNESEDDVDDTNWQQTHRTGPNTSPTRTRRLYSDRPSQVDLRSRRPTRLSYMDERSSLLENADGADQSYTSFVDSISATPRARVSRRHSIHDGVYMSKSHSRSALFSQRLVNALSSNGNAGYGGGGMEDSKTSFSEHRVWYDQVHDSIADAYRVKALRGQRGLGGRLRMMFDAMQGWILVGIIGCVTAIIAYGVDVSETCVFDIKEGYCTVHECDAWMSWSEKIGSTKVDNIWVDFAAYVTLVILFSLMACALTLRSRTVVPSTIQLATLDENLGADRWKEPPHYDSDRSNDHSPRNMGRRAPVGPMTYYSAAGSGVAEVKVILSGFVMHGYLGVRTLVIKTLALILSVGSGLSLGKEGPYVHIATCVGNIACRLFAKYNHNDGKRREVLSASAASGVAVAFGAPIGGTLFSLEEVSYYFPPKTLFRTFFCCIVAALSLKFLDPYGTGKIVIFEVRYVTDWRFFEMVAFILLGVMGGALGALFIKASSFWARTFRRIPMIKKYPLLEVFLVALLTGLVSFWNRYTRLPVTELLFELARPCEAAHIGTGLCPEMERTPEVISYLAIALVVKSILTTLTFGIKVPAGIYVPSMVVGGLLGRMVGHGVQYLVFLYPNAAIFGDCPSQGGAAHCVTPGVYAMVAAGATMCGVTRLSVALAVILFELTGSLDHVLPFSIAVLVSKWTADALEPLSIYDLLTDMNSYPFLDNKMRPIFTGQLGDIVPRVRSDRIIDVSNSPLVPARDLRRKLQVLHLAGEIDGGLPIVRDRVLVGLIPAPELEFALDKLDSEDSSLCLMSSGLGWSGSEDEGEGRGEQVAEPTDFTPYIDSAPLALEIRSPMDLAYECFVKLGLRYICVLRDGQYAGLVHKKAFVKYVKELVESQS